MCNLYDLIGIPFVDKGRDKSGCDCMGLAIMTHKAFNVDIPDFQVESDDSEKINSNFIEQLYSNKWVKLEKPEKPCIVVLGFNPYCPDMVTHVGTYIGDNKILHTLTDKSSTVFKLEHPFFKNKILGFYRYEQN